MAAFISWLVSFFRGPPYDGATISGGSLAYALKANGYSPRLSEAIVIGPAWAIPKYPKRRRRR